MGQVFIGGTHAGSVTHFRTLANPGRIGDAPTFWFIKIDNLTTVLHSFFGMGRFPVDAYPL